MKVILPGLFEKSGKESQILLTVPASSYIITIFKYLFCLHILIKTLSPNYMTEIDGIPQIRQTNRTR